MSAGTRFDTKPGMGWALASVGFLIVTMVTTTARADIADGYGESLLGDSSVGGGGVAVFVREGDALRFTVTDDTVGLYYDLTGINLIFADVTVELCPGQHGVVVFGRAHLCGSLSAADLAAFPGGWAGFVERLDAGEAILEIWQAGIVGLDDPPSVRHRHPVLPVSVDPGAFVDTLGSVHHDAIVALAAAGAVTGYRDGTFGAGDPVTRGQLASMVARTLRLPGRDTPSFSDVAGSVHELAINALAWRGIVVGRTDGSYGPNQPVTRAQAAAMLRRSMNLFTSGTDIADIEPFEDLDGSVHKGHIEALWQWGIVNGCAQQTYCPNANLTRGQAASLVARTYGWQTVNQRR